MTIGYPDWQAFPITSAAPIAATANFQLGSATPFSASGQVGNFASSRFRVRCSSFTVGATATLAYYTDSTQAITTGLYSWTVTAGTVLNLIVPNLGPFVTVSVTTTAAGPVTTQISLVGLAVSVSGARYVGTGNEAFMLNTSIAASGTSSVLLPFVAEGPGYWMATPSDALGKLNATVWELDQSGAQIEKVDEVLAFTTSFVRSILGASAGLRLLVTNTDAGAAHVLSARLCVDGR